jgi:hypothetical protein
MTSLQAAVRALLAGALASGAVGCGGDDRAGRVPLAQGGPNATGAADDESDRTLPPGMTPVSAALLDSGNVAFRMKQYPVARAYYERAAAAVPTLAAPWYGVYMVAQATSNQPLADSALKMVAQRSDGAALTAQEIGKAHSTMGDTTRALPPGHPPR